MLLVFAIPEESGNLFNEYRHIHTGIGKINAAYGLTKAIYEKRPKIVVNLGTAGSKQFEAGSIVNVVSLHTTPNGVTDQPSLNTIRMANMFRGNCLTLDKFSKPTLPTFDSSCFDMEAYALAHVCEQEKIPFVSIKYISDSGELTHWKESLKHAPQALYNALQSIPKPVSG